MGGLSHAKAGRDAHRCHPSGDDARHRRYRDGVSAQPHGVGQGLQRPDAARWVGAHADALKRLDRLSGNEGDNDLVRRSPDDHSHRLCAGRRQGGLLAHLREAHAARPVARAGEGPGPEHRLPLGLRSSPSPPSPSGGSELHARAPFSGGA